MNDTSPDVEAAYNAMFAARSATERLRMTCEMFETAKALVIAGIKAQSSDISDAELRVQLFERLYAGDFDAAMHDRIVAALRAPAGPYDA